MFLPFQAASQDSKSQVSLETYQHMLDLMKGTVTVLYSNLLMAHLMRALSQARYFVISHLKGNLVLVKAASGDLTSHKSTSRQEGMMAGISGKSTHTAKLREILFTFLSTLTPLSTSGWMEILIIQSFT